MSIEFQIDPQNFSMSDDIVDNKNSDSYDFKSAPNSMELLCMLKQIIFNLTQDNLEMSIEKTMKLLDLNFPYSNNLIISNLIYSAFYSKKDVNLLYINYLELIQAKEEEMNKNNLKIIQIFSDYIREIKSQESYYLIENMIERNLADPDIIKDIKSIYFAHHKLNNEIYELHFAPFWKQFNGNWKELSKNDWELHKQLIKEGVNPNEISKIIRSDELEKLQEISSQENFNFNQYIEPSLYERCSFINQKNVTLIDYAAFFGSVKCFKYLLINGAKVENTGKYAVAGGNEEIIHLCEQNHSTFEGAYETAIEFHQNDIFKYIYEKKLEKLDEKAQQNIFRNGKLQQSRFGNNNYYRSNYSLNNISNLGCICIKNGNTEIFLFLHENGMEINEYIIDETVRISNIYLIKYFLQNNYIPKNIIIFKSLLESFEIVQLLLEQKGIDINAKDYCGKTALIYASEFSCIEIVKLLLEQEGIDINAKNKDGNTALICASKKGRIEIVKLLLEQEGIDVNAKNKDRLTALIIAYKNYHIEIFNLLLAQKGIDINVKSKRGKTVLMMAIKKGLLKIVKLLLEHEGIDVNAKDNLGNTALIYAFEFGYIGIFKLILEQEGININTKDNLGQTVLIRTSRTGKIKLVKLLLEQKGIDINAKNNYGETALMKALENGQTEIVKLLLEQKAIDVNAKDNWGWTALTHASLRGNKEMVKLLEKSVNKNLKPKKHKSTACNNYYIILI